MRPISRDIAAGSLSMIGISRSVGVVMADSRKDRDQYSKEEADRRRDELARRILNTPPEPQKRLSGDKPKKRTGKVKRAK